MWLHLLAVTALLKVLPDGGIRRLVKLWGAAAIVAIGTCAAFGGIPKANPNPTAARGVWEVVTDKPVVNIPGCPAIPEVTTGTIAHFLVFGALPALDRLAGRFHGSLRVAGSTIEPLMRGRVRSAPFHIHWLHLDELSSEVMVDHQSMVLGDLTGRKQDLVMTGRIEIPPAVAGDRRPVRSGRSAVRGGGRRRTRGSV